MDLHEALQRYWGHEKFRQGQEDIIRSALEGYDNLVVMATGSGKSVCYQIMPVVTGKICIVISPLISLMEDQVAALTARGMAACFLGSAQRDMAVVASAWAGKFLWVYMTPELATRSLDRIRRLGQLRGLCLVAVDEAHCITEWGHDFRAEVVTCTATDIGINLRTWHKLKPCIWEFKDTSAKFKSNVHGIKFYFDSRTEAPNIYDVDAF